MNAIELFLSLIETHTVVYLKHNQQIYYYAIKNHKFELVLCVIIEKLHYNLISL